MATVATHLNVVGQLPVTLAILGHKVREAAGDIDTAEPERSTVEGKAAIQAIADEAAAIAGRLDELGRALVAQGVRVDPLDAAIVHAEPIAATIRQTAADLATLHNAPTTARTLYVCALALEPLAQRVAEAVATLAIKGSIRYAPTA